MFKLSNPIYGYTDYPILSLGDASGVEAPIRKAMLTAYDLDKYATILVDNGSVIWTKHEIKLGYFYKSQSRSSDHPKRFSISKIKRLVRQHSVIQYKKAH